MIYCHLYLCVTHKVAHGPDMRRLWNISSLPREVENPLLQALGIIRKL